MIPTSPNQERQPYGQSSNRNSYNVSSVLTKNLDKLIREDKRLTIERELTLS